MKILFLILFSLNALATLNEVDKAYIPSRNLPANPGFENGKASWTASGGTFAAVTSGSNKLEGNTSVTWDSGSAGQTLTSTAVTIPNGLLSKNGAFFCTILTPSGTATHTISVYDGSSTLASLTIVSNTSPKRSGSTFIIPSSGSISIRFTSVASDEPLIAIDDCYLGTADGTYLINLKPQDVFSAAVSSADAVSNENADFINGNCTNATTGKATCTWTAGYFPTSAPNCTVTPSSATDGRIATIESVSTTSIIVTTTDDAGTLTDIGFQISCQKAAADSPAVGYNPDVSALSWSGYHDNTCSWARTNTAYGDPTADATCALAQRTNNNFGTVTTYTVTNPEPGIIFTPKIAGRYFVKASIKVALSNLAAYGDVRLWDGSTVIAEEQTQAEVANDIQNLVVSGIYVASSTSSVTLSLQTKASAGSITIAANSTNTSAVEWTIFAIDQSFPMPSVTNSVVNPANSGVRIATAFITNTGTPVVTREDGDWLGAITDNGTGDSTLAINAGTFTSTPNCVVTTYDTGSGSICYIKNTTAISTTAVRTQCVNSGFAATDMSHFIMCVGSK